MVHENFPSANVNQINPLSQGQFVIALVPSSKKGDLMEVFLGEGKCCCMFRLPSCSLSSIVVITIYSRGKGKNAKHEWVTRIESLGVALYVYVRKFVPFAGDSVFTSLSCRQMTTSTYIQVPRTHLLFSLGSYSVTPGQPVAVAGFNFDLINLCPASATVYATLNGSRPTISTCIRNLQALIAGKDIASVTVFAKEESEESDGSESELDD